MPLAIAVHKSGNEKLARAGSSAKGGIGRVSTTYASIETSCPKTCVLYHTGECYAQLGQVGMHVSRLDQVGTPEETARAEARALDNLFKGGPVPQDGARGGRDLRLHTSGDARTKRAVSILAAAVERWYERGGGMAWTYTHAWNKVHRLFWNGVSVLGSIDSLNQLSDVRAAMYAPARYVSEFPDHGKSWVEDGIRWIPCPAQLREDIACADCRLCMNADALYERNAGIAFAAHGVRSKMMRKRLAVVVE